MLLTKRECPGLVALIGIALYFIVITPLSADPIIADELFECV